MNTSFYTSRSAMMAQQNKLDLISNNIANVSTVGYKKLTTDFEDLYRNSLNKDGIPAGENKEDLYVGTGVKDKNALRVNTQGALNVTGTKTDLAIDGTGMFKLYQNDGTAVYSRNGSFTVDTTGTIVDANGNRLSIVDDNGNDVNLPGNNVTFTSSNFTVNSDGEVLIDQNGNSVKVGNIKTYSAVGNSDFISVGQNLFSPAQGATIFETTGREIYQGYTEKSNVEVATEMSDMIVAQRAYQLSSSAIKTADEMWQMANNLR